MKRRSVILFSTLLLSPSAWAQQAAEASGEAAATAAPMPELATPASPMDKIFREIVEEAMQIDRILNEVTDKESADATAEILARLMEHMDTQLHALEQYPLHREQDAEALKTHMVTLTRISQNYLSTMQRLTEVNAYGSETLIALFKHYKVDGGKITRLQADDLPHTQLYGELADALEDLIYILNRVQSAEAAARSLPALHSLHSAMQRTHNMLSQLVPPTTDEQKEAVRPTRERLRKLSTELRSAIERLQNAQCYGNPALDALLPGLLQVSAS